MKTLIIHPDDRSTDFLRDIYRNSVLNATVITKDISRDTLHKFINSHDQIVMLGHGSPYGLFNVSDIGNGIYTIGPSEVSLLQNKQCVFIWCHADDFVRQYKLKGLSSGMFISEVSEARYCNVSGDQEHVDRSNSVFACALGFALALEKPYGEVLEHVAVRYKVLIPENQVAQYNLERWQLIN